ncbi:hypothetical protein MI170_01330 [Mycolicibacterium goodii]|uniref:hypothetical protein n=1 Tax=Mycolicibacterium goodii TaxID=134601 RepID=UPI001F042282|nr:hypothetical protein [Mycolicibacterium goodii]ULN48061.1 hypothetical protein MI170_01330 [Mycolicibacterium goodii]
MTREFTVEGRQMFAAELKRFADRGGDGNPDPRLAKISARVSAPFAVSVHGRRGVGVTTVGEALAASGVAVRGAGPEEVGELAVLVTAEVLKPEDLVVAEDLRSLGVEVLVVLNKADLAGCFREGLLAAAHDHARRLRERSGLPVVPMVGLLSRVALSQHLVAALRELVATPADLSSTDAFLLAPHPVAPAIRAELLRTLDRFGIVHACLELSRNPDCDPEDLCATLRRLGEIDRVLAALDALMAPLFYRRIERALVDLQAVGGESVGRFLAADATVLAVMRAAEDVVGADGPAALAPVTACGCDAHLRRARYWWRYSRGPVDALHRSCGMAIARGSLRLAPGGEAGAEGAVRR